MALVLGAIVAIVYAIGRSSGGSSPCACCKQPNSVRSAYRLPAEERQKILRYFLEAEARQPSLGAVSVCETCHCVYDDHLNGPRSFIDSAGNGRGDGLLCLCKQCRHRILAVATEPIICP